MRIVTAPALSSAESGREQRKPEVPGRPPWRVGAGSGGGHDSAGLQETCQTSAALWVDLA